MKGLFDRLPEGGSGGAVWQFCRLLYRENPTRFSMAFGVASSARRTDA